jgi:Uma2 family endonuclease
MVSHDSITVLYPPEERVEIHRLSRSHFHGLVTAGVVSEGARVELLDGAIVDLPMQDPPHSVACELVAEAFSHLGDGLHLRTQKPLALEEFSEPEPDVVIVEGRVRDYLADHPAPDRVRLLVEVSDSTLSKDRGRKLRAYARNGVGEYWILNLVDRQLEIHRDPQGEIYRDREVLRQNDRAIAASVDGRTIRVADLLP